MRRIFLIGYRCTGKTTVGKALAQALNMDFLDLDDFIVQRAGRSIQELVSQHGWPYFRSLERQALKEVMNSPNSVVVSCGGGVVLHGELLPQIKASGLVVWLKADIATILDRLLKDLRTRHQRPSLMSGMQLEEETRHILKERLPLYEAWADVAVQTDHATVQEVVEEIRRVVSKGVS
jgi:shikimate kinase